MAIATAAILIVCIQSAFANGVVGQCPVGDPTCRASSDADDATLLQSRVQIENSDVDDVQAAKKSAEEANRGFPSMKKLKDKKDRIANAAKRKAEELAKKTADAAKKKKDELAEEAKKLADAAKKQKDELEAAAKKKADELAKKLADAAKKKADELAKKLADEAKKKKDELAEAAKKLADEAKKKSEELAKKAADEAKKKVDELAKEAAELAKKAAKEAAGIVEEAVDQAQKATTEALLKAKTAATTWTDKAWEDTKEHLEKEAAKVGEDAAKLADSLTPFGKCVDIKQLMMDLFFGVSDKAESFIDMAKSDLDIALSSAPKLSATIGATIGSALSLVEEPAFSEYTMTNGMSLVEAMSQRDVPTIDKAFEWGYGPEKIGPLTITSGAKLAFSPVLKMDLEPAIGKIKIHVSGEVKAIAYTDIDAAGAGKFAVEKSFPKKPKTMVACAGPFCLSLMIQGQVLLDAQVEAEGHASAEVRASYQVEGDVTIDIKTGEATTTYSTGKLLHSEKIKYESSFQGNMNLTVGPTFTILPFPGVPVTLSPWVKAELKAFAQGSGSQENSGSVIETTSDMAAAEPVGSDTDLSSSKIEDSTGFWQTKVAVEAAAETTTTTTTTTVTRHVFKMKKSCGKAGVNIHAGAKVEALGFPTTISLDSDFLKETLTKMVLDALAGMPMKAVAAITKMIEKCTGIPGLSDAVDKFDGIIKDAVKDVAGLIPDFKISFGVPKMLYQTPAGVCLNVWKDILPKGTDQCGTYDVGCVHSIL